MTDFVQMSTTTASVEEAQQIAAALIQQKIAACVQIIPDAKSVYYWQGQLEQSSEYLCLIKTRRALVTDVESVVLDLHSYDCPEIIAIGIESVSDAYGQWMIDQLR